MCNIICPFRHNYVHINIFTCKRHRHHGQKHSNKEPHTYNPDQDAGDHSRLSSKSDGTEWKPQNDEAVQRDEADDEGRHLRGQQKQDTSNTTRIAGRPGVLVPQVLATVHLVRDPYHGQVHAHQEIGQAQVGHEDVEAGLSLKYKSQNKTADIPDDGQGTGHPEKYAVRVGTNQVLA